jgi:hypothetical protein
VTKILNLDHVSCITTDPSNKRVEYFVFIDGDCVILPQPEGERLIQAWSIHQTAKYASYHAGEFIPNGIPSFPLIKSALLIDTYLADAAHNAHLVPEEE